MTLDTILWLAGSAIDLALIALLFYHCVWRSFPVFLAYSVWYLAESLAGFIAFRWFRGEYLHTYMAAMVVDSALLFGVLVELGWSIIRPLRSSLSRMAPFIVGLVILAAGAVIWPFAAVKAAPGMRPALLPLLHVQQTFYILRVVVFVALAAGSQWLSIGWRSRELQIATGLGFTSVVTLAVAMVHSYHLTRPEFYRLNELVVASFICSLLYWIVSFSRQEEARRPMSPQMQSVLLAVAGAARSTRIALAETDTGKRRNAAESDLSAAPIQAPRDPRSPRRRAGR